ncbi:aromatase/cyclase [Polyangium jinanense]|uniref:SRPBCC family protein n=1 Tax=Polyangium jinanense TaxID=2829994 RepID=A0A9X4AY60_9BACT|nr:SRPBCC family protein [Polyangium jinanense]MDC3989284.1 SRPBCC family protein [Polyangium jinanense]
MKTKHSIDMACPPELAFRIGLDVSRWPEIFPPCLCAKVLEETDTRQKIALTARANNGVFSWESVRSIDRQHRLISFAQSKPSPLVRSMHGMWSFEKTATGCRVTLTHDFEIAEDVSGVVEGVNTHEEAARFMMKTVETNSMKELAAIGARVEREKWRHEFQEALVIKQPPGLIMRLLGDAASWPWLLEHCDGVDMLYNDGSFQEFVMVVRVGEREERIRSIRVLSKDRIEYFQPEPPPALREHRGRWTVVESPEGVEVVSWHEVVLNPLYWADKDIDAAKRQVEAAINRNSLGTMKAIQGKLAATTRA